jgi:DNA-damage-inducible protein J
MLTIDRSVTYQIRINKEEKQKTFEVFNELGITPAQAVKMFFTQVRRTNSIPFSIEKIPNNETIKTIEEAQNGENLIVCKDADDLFNKLGI